MKTTSAILTEAARIVDSGWTKFAGAKDSDNETVPTSDPRARSFCAMGAICKAAERLGLPETEVVLAMQYFQQVNKIENIIRWNDNWDREKGEVLRAFDWAAKRSQNQNLVSEVAGCG